MTDLFYSLIPFLIDLTIAVVKSPVFICIFVFLIFFGVCGLIKELRFWV